MNEVGEFPFVCENCLGPDPYVRMIKSKQGAQCKLTSRPFTSFKWRVRGSANGAWRNTQICIEIAKLKNCCQVCLRDMTYLVPMNVRDSVMKNNPYNVQLPSSFVGQQYFLERKARELEQNGSSSGSNPMIRNNLIPPPPPPKQYGLVQQQQQQLLIPPPPPVQYGLVQQQQQHQQLLIPPPPPPPSQLSSQRTSEKRLRDDDNNIFDNNNNNNNNNNNSSKRVKISSTSNTNNNDNDKKVKTIMGYGQVLAKRLDDNMYIVQLEWKLAQGQKARIYTKHLL